ncbi:putative efflux protein MATE family [Clostridium sp. CAG:1013]|nr:putative efflux protein MATE family [Clostridium sp. CAG:1013]
MAVENDLGKDKISSLVWKIAIPSMLGQFVSVLYSIVDRMYIGNIPEVGDIALAGVGVCGPVVNLVGSVAFLIGVGGAPLVSIRMGEGNLKAAKQVLANCFLMLCVFSVVLVAGILPFREPMLRLFGASDATYPYAESYFTAYLCGTFFALAAAGLNQFVICQGFAKAGMASVVLGAVLNIALDPVFIFVLDMGVQGAAIATVISQAASAAFVVLFLFGKRVMVPITFGGYDLRIMGRVLVVGFTPFLIVAIDNVMIIAMNAILQTTGGAEGDMLVTCNTIVQSFMLVVTMPLGGISGGTQGILGYNYGARQVDRVRQAQKYIVGLCVGYTALMFVLARVAGPLFVRLFTQEPQLAEEAFDAIKICTLAIIPLGVQYELVDGFTGIGQVRLSLPLSFWRKLVYFVAIFLLPMAFGARAAFYAQPLSDVLGPLVTVIVYLLTMGKILKERAASPQ